MQEFWQYRYQLLEGLTLTVELTVLSGLLALLISLIVGTGVLSGSLFIRYICRIYIEFFRGTSLLAQMFWLFFVLPNLGIDLSPITCGVWSLGLCFGGYGAEIVRSSLVSVPKGQHDAAIALNFSKFKALRYIYLPQAVMLMLPLFSNLFIELLKATSLVSLITISELTFQAKNLIFLTYDTAKILIFILIVYFALSQVISRSLRGLENALARNWRA